MKDQSSPVVVVCGNALLKGDMLLPRRARGMVLFAHGSGSSRFSPRNRFVARSLHQAGLGSLLMDLLTEEEEAQDRSSAEFRFDIPLLAKRVRACARWLATDPRTKRLPVGYFGASTGAAAALVAAAQGAGNVRSVVSRGGRPDLARGYLPLVRVPTLLIVGEKDGEVLALNREAAGLMRARCDVQVVAGASHLFEEPGTLEEAADLAARWFLEHLAAPAGVPAKGG